MKLLHCLLLQIIVKNRIARLIERLTCDQPCLWDYANFTTTKTYFIEENYGEFEFYSIFSNVFFIERDLVLEIKPDNITLRSICFFS